MPAGQRGIVINISGDPSNVKEALGVVREEMRRTQEAGDAAGETFNRVGTNLGHGVPAMAAASAGLRALEGNFTNNIRAGERFLSMLPGMPALLGAAFPVVGAAVLATALVRMGTEAYNAYQNIVHLKSALDDLNHLDITVAKKLQSDQDQIERSTEQFIEATQGHVAALKYKLSQDGAKPIDLSELFYDKDFSSKKDNIKANYETLYKSVAPGDAAAKLQGIRSEVAQLNGALDQIKGGQTGAFVPIVGGFGPSITEDPTKYYTARLKAATDVEKELASAIGVRQAAQQATQAEIDKPQKEARTPAVRSDNAIPEARARLAEALAQQELAQRKANAEQELSDDETLHRTLLMSDQEFLAEKLRLQNVEFDAEEKALKDRLGTLQALYDKQHSDKTLKRDSSGTSAEELNTQRQMVELQGQLTAIGDRRAKASDTNASEVNAANVAAELANLRAAAELEAQRNNSVTARIALLRAEADLEARKLVNQGGSPQAAQQIRDLAERKAQELELGDVQRQVAETEESYNLRAQRVEDEAAKGLLTRKQAEQQLNAIHQQEAQALETLVEQYQALADVLGGPYKQKAAELEAELQKLNTPNQKVEAQFGKQITDGVTQMADTIAEQTARGKTSFHDMVKEIEGDLARLATKLTMQAIFGQSSGASGLGGGGGRGGGGLLGSLLSGLLGGGGPGAAGLAAAQSAAAAGGAVAPIASDLTAMIPGFAAGTDSAPGGPSLVGEEGPELVNLPKGSSVTPSNVLTKIAESGSGARTPNITTNVINQTSNPVTSQPSQVSFDSELREFVVNTVLTDHAQGGPIAQSLAGLQQS